MRAVRDCMIVSPPLVIRDEEIDELVRLARRCLDLTLESSARRGEAGGVTATRSRADAR